MSERDERPHFGPGCDACPLFQYVDDEDQIQRLCKRYKPGARECGVAVDAWREGWEDGARLFGSLSSLRRLYADLCAEVAVLRLMVSIDGPTASGQLVRRLREGQKMLLAMAKGVGAGGGRPVKRVAGKIVPDVR